MRLFFSRLMPCLIFFIGMIYVVFPFFKAHLLPGDMGDARFNFYVLEHCYQVIMGYQSSFVNAPFFAPWVKTILFSDTHWGTVPVYILFRSLPITKEAAFGLWFALGFVLNYWATYWVARQFGLGRLGGTIAAFVFTFGIPVLAQAGHAQLLYRFYVPLASWAFDRFLKKWDPRLLAATMFFVAMQLLSTIYIGMFLTYFLLAFSLAYIIVTPWSVIRSAFLQRQSLIFSQWLVAVVIFFIALIVLYVVASNYLAVQHLYHFGRPWGQIKVGLPTWKSYFIADNSNLWFSQHFFRHYPIYSRPENHLFVGVGVFVSFIAATFYVIKKPVSLIYKQLLLTVFFLFAATLSFDHLSFYYFVSFMPGADALRSVSRVILVMLFPIAILSGLILERWTEFKNWRVLAYLLILLIVLDSSLLNRCLTNAKDWRTRMLTMRKQTAGLVLKADTVLVVRDGKDPYITDLDAMLFAQEERMTTLNGYSGNFPPGYVAMYTCKDVLNNIEIAEKFFQIKINKANLVYIGFAKPCFHQ